MRTSLMVFVPMLLCTVGVLSAQQNENTGFRDLLYTPENGEFVIRNGTSHYNRPLFGTNTAFSFVAGDLPDFIFSLPGKGGTLWIGIVSGERSKWLTAADYVEMRYRHGAIRYMVRDSLLDQATLEIDVVTLTRAEGAVLRFDLIGDIKSKAMLVWAFGGASGYNNNNLDTTGYCPESALLLKSKDCNENSFETSERTFKLNALCLKNRPIIGVVSVAAKYSICDADANASPAELLAKKAQKWPMLTGVIDITSGKSVYLGLERPETGIEPVLNPENLHNAYLDGEQCRARLLERVRVSTPDPYINTAVGSMISIADGIWDGNTYVEGAQSWRDRYPGWRQAYVGTAFGWHDRMREHFRTYIAAISTEPESMKPEPGSEWNLARQSFKSVLYSKGYIPVSAVRGNKSWYNMNEVFFDQLLRYILWSGDIEFLRKTWPAIKDHLAWEKRCFDPDNDGLYENYANIWLSDSIQYSGGGCTTASSYTYLANLYAGQLAKLLNEDSSGYESEARKILTALNTNLWTPDSGTFAEYRDALGLKLVHKEPYIASLYHCMDSEVPDKFQAYQMMRYIDTSLEHVAVRPDAKTVFTSNWLPSFWCVRQIAQEETAHAALACWQANCRDKAMELMRGTILDGMYCSRVPGGVIGFSALDPYLAQYKGLCGEWGDTAGIYSRMLVEGLFGIVLDGLHSTVTIRPGFPASWDFASISTPDVEYSYKRDGLVEKYEVFCKSSPRSLVLHLPALRDTVSSVKCNGQDVSFKPVESVGQPQIGIAVKSSLRHVIEIGWAGQVPQTVINAKIQSYGQKMLVQFSSAKLVDMYDPQNALGQVAKSENGFTAVPIGLKGNRTVFARISQGQLNWYMPIEFEIRDAIELVNHANAIDGLKLELRNNTSDPIDSNALITIGNTERQVHVSIPAGANGSVIVNEPVLLPGTNPVKVDFAQGRSAQLTLADWGWSLTQVDQQKLRPVDINDFFNDNVTQIFEHKYLSPRSPYCSLQIPLNGYGEWCHYGQNKPVIDDSIVRNVVSQSGRFAVIGGISFASPAKAGVPNIIFVSQWDNFPHEISVPLSGRARHAYFLMTGSASWMQSQFDNGEVIVTYKNGQQERLALHNPTTWWPIERNYDLRTDKWCFGNAVIPPRVAIGKNTYATVLDLPLNPGQELKNATVRCIANEVVIGMMAITLLD